MSAYAKGPLAAPDQLEDALVYLPRKTPLEFRRNQVIYDELKPSTGLYLNIRGRVKIAIREDDGSQIVTGVIGPDEFFGESSLLGPPRHQERATVIDPATLMTWSVAEIEEQIVRQPKLGLALIQILVDRCMDFEERLQSLALDKTPERVALSLLRFAGRLGTRGSNGYTHVPPFTHQLLSEYIGTSREIVTFQMNRLREQGYLTYSRKGIEVSADALAEHLRQQE